MVTVGSVPGCVALEVLIAVPPDQVWSVLTTPEGQAQFVPGAQSTEFDARVGGSFEWSGIVKSGARYTMRGRVIEFTPPQLLVLAWDWKDSGVPETVVRITLEPTQSGTKVSLLHSGFPSQFEPARGLNQLNWSIALEALKQSAEGDPRAARPPAYGWPSASSEGRTK